MPLELKIESLRARGELSVEERDRLMQALAGHPPAPPPKRRRLTPLRLFLLGVVVGLAVAYLVWVRLS